ncbi:MAG TPA: cobyric acid synthase CobQ, partial [Xanthobacteraceae bacterium]|nr:cobyric acid synthase CobQ [Xanthobacteraceae bacterium]
DARLLPAEDALALEQNRPAKPERRVRIAMLVLPHIANFDDFDPLEAEPAIEIVRVRPGTALPGDADLIILPGSKATIADLAALRAAGFDLDIAGHRRRGGTILGLCGGFQMLGRMIADPNGIEGPPAAVDGLGLIDVTTTLAAEKRLEAVSGTTSNGAPFAGYEMHMGVTAGPDCARPFARFADGSPEGAISADGRVMGTYVHGLFADDRQRAAWLARFVGGDVSVAYEDLIEQTLDALAAHLAAHVDIDRLLTLAR